MCILTSIVFYRKIDELQYIVKLSEAAVIGISESKLDDSVLSSEIQIENYDLIRSDRNRHCDGVTWFFLLLIFYFLFLLFMQ